MSPRARLHEEQRGATLVELMVVLLLVTMIGGYTTTALIQGMRTAARAQERVYALVDLERISQRVSRELRAADPVLVAGADAVEAVVYRDLDGDGDLERLRYRFQRSGPALTQTLVTYPDPSASTPLSTVTTPLGDGLDQSGLITFAYEKDGAVPWVAGTDPLADIRTVRLSFGHSLRAPADPIVVQTAVQLRNTGFGG